MTMRAVRNRDENNDFIRFTAAYGPVNFAIDESRGHALAFWHELGKLVIDGAEDRARGGYERYVAASGGKSFFSGDTLIKWDDLPGPVRESWVAAFTE